VTLTCVVASRIFVKLESESISCKTLPRAYTGGIYASGTAVWAIVCATQMGINYRQSSGTESLCPDAACRHTEAYPHSPLVFHILVVVAVAQDGVWISSCHRPSGLILKLKPNLAYLLYLNNLLENLTSGLA